MRSFGYHEKPLLNQSYDQPGNRSELNAYRKAITVTVPSQKGEDRMMKLSGGSKNDQTSAPNLSRNPNSNFIIIEQLEDGEMSPVIKYLKQVDESEYTQNMVKPPILSTISEAAPFDCNVSNVEEGQKNLVAPSRAQDQL